MHERSTDVDELLVAEGDRMKQVAAEVREVAASDTTVLIEGERGTGREFWARAIHYASSRRGASFVSIKAATIPRTRIGTELYDSSRGMLGQAAGGTILLKDVGNLPLDSQRSLAQVIDGQASGIDVRLITASEEDLRPCVEADVFDRDLYARLAAQRIRIPPLRERSEDIPRLALMFLRERGAECGRTGLRIATRALDRLVAYPWPGNVGELKAVCRDLALRLKGAVVSADDVAATLPRIEDRIPMEEMGLEDMVRAKVRCFLARAGNDPMVDDLHGQILVQVERPLILAVLEHTQGNQVRAARLLGMNRNTLRKKLGALGLAEVASARGRLPARSSRR